MFQESYGESFLSTSHGKHSSHGFEFIRSHSGHVVKNFISEERFNHSNVCSNRLLSVHAIETSLKRGLFLDSDIQSRVMRVPHVTPKWLLHAIFCNRLVVDKSALQTIDIEGI